MNRIRNENRNRKGLESWSSHNYTITYFQGQSWKEFRMQFSTFNKSSLVNYRSLAPLSSQKVSYISFQNTDNLQVYFSALDSGDKTVIVDNVAYLTLSGRMYERAASMRFFVRNSPSVLFEDFYATTPILLINLMVMFVQFFKI